MGRNVTVRKLDSRGQLVFEYQATVLERRQSSIQLEAHFNIPDYVASFHTFKKGDRFIEWFYSDRWYNIFEMYDVDDGLLKGWYCNITRPAEITATSISAEDLALDLMVYPDGRMLVLDEDEFERLELDSNARGQALAALETLRLMARSGKDMFSKIESDHV